MVPSLLRYFFNSFPICLCLTAVVCATSIYALIKPPIFFKLMLHPYSIVNDNQISRLLTADLVHNDLVHLLLNVFMMATFCCRLEDYLRNKTAFGAWMFPGIYTISALCGGLAATVRHRKDYQFSSAGNSGSIMGCMFSYILLQPDEIAYYVPVFGGVTNLYGGLLFIVAMIFYQARSKNDLASHEVHFFGALGGICTTIVMLLVMK